MSVAFIAVKSDEDKKAVTNFDVNASIITEGRAQTQSNNGMLVLRRGICVSISKLVLLILVLKLMFIKKIQMLFPKHLTELKFLMLLQLGMEKKLENCNLV